MHPYSSVSALHLLSFLVHGHGPSPPAGVRRSHASGNCPARVVRILSQESLEEKHVSA